MQKTKERRDIMEEMKVKIEIGLNLENSYVNLPKIFYDEQNPTPVDSPKLVILNNPLVKYLGLDVESLKNNEIIEMFAGNSMPEGANPIAQAYAGHQFGHFTMLGDGRAILLGEQITPKGERFDIQLKGPGRTRYSRGGDGRAALGPMLREYIISEAMHALGIPTTRSLAVVTTGESVIRDNILPGAILTRIASSHIRVGTFQYAGEYCSIEELKALADYTLKRHFSDNNASENRYLFLLKEVIKRQASLIAKWMHVGFIHGVMNTDNMTISGESIDYGPCAFMDTYDPATVFSSIDRQGRYAYGNQPYIAGWNLTRFAETLLPLLDNNEDNAVEIAQSAISDFTDLYRGYWLSGMRSKLGIINEETEDQALALDLLNIMKENKADYTNTFIALTFDRFSDMELFSTDEFKSWYKKWQNRLDRQQESRDSSYELMRNSNPAVIPRNHRVEEALEAANKGDYSVFERLLDAISKPYAHLPEQKDYATLPKKNCTYRTFCGT